MIAHASEIRTLLHSHRRAVCIWLFALVVIYLSAFPPWVATYETYRGRRERQEALYRAPLWKRPVVYPEALSVQVDLPRLLLEVLAGEAVVGALYLTWGKKP